MNYSNFLSKTASDKHGVKLGKIIRIEDLIGETIKKYKPYAIIQVRRFLQKEIHVPIDLEKVIKEQEGQVMFDISKEEFDAEIKRMEVLRNERETYDDFVKTDSSLYSARGSIKTRPTSRRKKK
ncbi:MAG: hypothetical protein KGD59_11435 [Candidatus Heimdallarchaeota archaeon]|nr:hypothetical protein [Candidatus Heimdallarchaeota archaeon]MBY8995155.1 hypothetical protein [Candidatus Heimdallarchaeota archaeon]